MTTNISFEKTVSLEKNNSTKTKPYFSVSLLKWMQHKEWLKRNQHTVVEGVNHTTCTVPEITSMEALSKLEQEVSSLAEEQKDFDTWCQEILAQPMHQHLRADLNWIAEKKQERMEYLISELNHLSKLILYRLAYRKDNLDQSILDEIEKNVAIDNAFAKINSTEQFDIDLNKMEESIHQQLRHELLATTQESIVFALALIGWTLFLIPGLQLPAIIFISLGTASYLLKNVYELWTFAQTKEDHNLSYTY